MTMHLVHPALSTTGKKKGKRKFRNAEQARLAREHEASWKLLLEKHKVRVGVKPTPANVRTKPTYRGCDEPKIPSLPFTGEPCVRPVDKVYTGDKMLGISVLHKSNAVPVFSRQDAIDISKMRR